MASPKARRHGAPGFADGLRLCALEQPWDFSDSLRVALREHCPPCADAALAADEEALGKDQFVEALLAEARWGRHALVRLRMALTKEDALKECSDLLGRLDGVRDDLRRLSPDLDRMLGVDADPLGCADAIDRLADAFRHASEAIGGAAPRRRSDDLEREIAIEMTARVLDQAERYGVRVTATADADRGSSSDAVSIMKKIGYDMGIVREAVTWRDTIIEARKRRAVAPSPSKPATATK